MLTLGCSFEHSCAAVGHDVLLGVDGYFCAMSHAEDSVVPKRQTVLWISVSTWYEVDLIVKLLPTSDLKQIALAWVGQIRSQF